jgi:hypothetical protein
MEVFKKCNVRGECCEDKYDMSLRAEEIKYEVFKFDPPRYDACSNPNCQAKVPTKKKNGRKPKD